MRRALGRYSALAGVGLLVAAVLSVSGAAYGRDARASAAQKATRATFSGTWYGHTRSLRITRAGVANEDISAGCCDRIIHLRMRLSQARGTSTDATVAARVTAIRWYDRAGWSGRAPYVGEVRRIRLRNGVIHEKITGTVYCDLAADATGACGA